ncbi:MULTISPECIES: NAD-dependent epimerase/dehydratase family protein [Niastella]|uniref:NAD-dependent epimerase/dehydratase family protein n=1 Tax=Niastella soli TaxID=2821487 RepID=A0ABS3YN06_9BACT|nr:NAD-dependent epimerase/dehydratase family protein [Niastella soli]MBO9198972.1 NAD-dependent epimerase/dehydratase family protein [Niastella soli]
MHTIFGAGGAVADQLLPILLHSQQKVRLVSRTAKAIPGVESVAADATNYTQTLQAIKGSSVVYLLLGLPYDIRIWRAQWPVIMTNVINACKETGARLIFFDNVYMYGKVNGWMTEETAFNPCSKKGEVRAAIANQLLQEIKAGNLQAMIARCADFYGPIGFKTSVPNLLVIQNLIKGKKAQWLGSADQPHSITYVPDAARALYLLANKPEAFGQTWHLPTASELITGRQFAKEAAAVMQKPDGVSAIPGWMLSLIGLFNRPLKELKEMNYQSDSPYLFSSDKFNKAFGFTPTSYSDGIKETCLWAMESGK